MGATVRYVNQDTGQNWKLKTNKKGEYMSIGVAPNHKYNGHSDRFRWQRSDHVNDKCWVAMIDNQTC